MRTVTFVAALALALSPGLALAKGGHHGGGHHGGHHAGGVVQASTDDGAHGKQTAGGASAGNGEVGGVALGSTDDGARGPGQR